MKGGKLLQYVDDGLVVCPRWLVDELVAITIEFLKGLLGSCAVAMEKLQRGKSLVHIGYKFSFDRGIVTIAHRNCLKALYAFNTKGLQEGRMVTVKLMQKLASLACRYGMICRLMKPFVRILFSSFRGRQKLVHVRITKETVLVIRLFRCLFIVVALHGNSFARTFESFEDRPPQWVVEFDACLSGTGIIWYRVSGNKKIPVSFAIVDWSFLGFQDDSSYQNTSEYLCGISRPACRDPLRVLIR